MTEIPKDTDTRIKKLKESPLFNLSLASKELFHSNFLAWVVETYKKDAIASLFPGYKLEYERIEVLRERSNIDLIVVFYNKEKTIGRIILENKVKSLPYKEQLDKYSKKIVNYKGFEAAKSNHLFILLAMNKNNPSFFDDDKYTTTAIFSGKKEKKSVKVFWNYLSYKTFIKRLEAMGAQCQKDDDDYHKRIVADYCDFMSEQVSILNGEHDMWEKMANNKNNDAFLEYDTYKQLQDVRLHDLYDKSRFEFLMRKILDKLPKTEISPKYEEGKFKVQFNMTRAIGLVDIAYTIKSKTEGKEQKRSTIGVQIQGTQFRLFYYTDDKRLRSKGAADSQVKSLYDSNEWFFRFDDKNTQGYKKNRDGTLSKFCGYHTSSYDMYYNYVDVKSLSLLELLEEVKLWCDKIPTLAKKLQREWS